MDDLLWPETVVAVRLTIAATNWRIDLNAIFWPYSTATLHVSAAACAARKIAYLAIRARRADEPSVNRRFIGDDRRLRLSATSQEGTG